MAKTKGGNSAARKFRVLNEAELNRLNETDRKAYEKKLAAFKRNQEKKHAKEESGKKAESRLNMLEYVLQTPVMRKSDISCDLIDATFISPCKRTMFATENLLVKFFDKGDLIQINCHAVPQAKVPCVVIKNGVFYFAQKKDEKGQEYANLDSNCTEENATIIASEDEYIGDIVNIIRDPKSLFNEVKKDQDNDAGKDKKTQA